MNRRKPRKKSNFNQINSNVSFINARRNKGSFNHQWNEKNKQRFTNSKQVTQDYLSKINFSNIESIINAILEQFKVGDLDKLHRIDEKVLEEAIVSFKKEFVELALIAYSFRKLMSKKHILNNPNWNGFKAKTIENLEQAVVFYKENNVEKYNLKIKEIQTSIEKTDQLLGHFIHDIIFNARIKLASTAYAYGLSLSQASNLLSADKDHVMEIIGQTKMSDEDMKNISISDRVFFLKKKVPKKIIKE